MRIGIYNRWLATLGGGEKYSLALAEHLSQRHSVQVITHTPVSKEHAATQLNLDLARVEFLAIPDRPAMQMTPLTRNYDFFITASFLDIFPSQAPRSAMVVFFPTPLGVEPALRFRRKVGLAIKNLLKVPSFEGILSTRVVQASHLRETISPITVRLAPMAREYRVSFDLASRNECVRQATVLLDEQIVETLNLGSNGSWSNCRLIVPAHPRVERTLTVRSETEGKTNDALPAKMALGHFQIEHPRYKLYQLIFERWLGEWGLKLYRIPSHVNPFLASIKTYDAIWAISEFTQSWIKRYWNLPSQILYPPVDIEEFQPGLKKNRILSVGRFFVGSHNKKHDEMVTLFKKIVDAGLSDWELHLAGGTAPGDQSQAYVAGIENESRGYPIFIHRDMSRQELLELYASSAIYWHASGYGEDDEADPIRFEHFGITTVEAMAAGCVPVVIRKGGQKEIVRHGQNGFLWESAAELKEQTMRLIQDGSLRAKLASAAIEDSKAFSKIHFDLRLDKLVKNLGIE